MRGFVAVPPQIPQNMRGFFFRGGGRQRGERERRKNGERGGGAQMAIVCMCSCSIAYYSEFPLGKPGCPTNNDPLMTYSYIKIGGGGAPRSSN